MKLGEIDDLLDCKLESLAGAPTLEMEEIKLRECSSKNIADIMEKGVTRHNQEMIIDEIWCDEEEFDKLGDKRYRVTFKTDTLTSLDESIVIKVVLGNVGFEIDPKDVEYYRDSKKVLVKYARMTVRNGFEYSFKEIDS